MSKIPSDYIERVYSGWLGKLIGIRLGAPIEGWLYDKIKDTYGEIDGYLVDYKDFAADDDSNGPIFFLRALEDYTYTRDITAEKIGLTWLNYASCGHGFYWWGGYGVSTENTAYLNLRSGIMAPQSGSLEQNGVLTAEQIGGQIFIDTWGLIAPGDPELAAEYARKAASVSHDRNGIYGGMFIAACISAAFVEEDIERIIEHGLSVIPSDCEYTRVVRDVMGFHKEKPGNWRECFQFVKDYYGYDKYLGGCHIIPNTAVIVLALLYGEGDFSRSICICNMCGWDTDCNVGNLGTIMGVRNGLEGIDYDKWRKPINDFFICSSVIGSLNIMDIPWCASYIAHFGYLISGEAPPWDWAQILSYEGVRFHFEYPGSTHGFRTSDENGNPIACGLSNSTEYACSGKASLRLSIEPQAGTGAARLYYKTYYRPEDFYDSRYDPSFSPVLYPGQSVRGCVLLPEAYKNEVSAALYIKDGNSGRYIDGGAIKLQPGQWKELTLEIPYFDAACIEQAGIVIHGADKDRELVIYMDDMEFSGKPDYNVDFSRERVENWVWKHQEISQFTRLKGMWRLENNELSGNTHDYAEAYTGNYYWRDYSFEATLIPRIGDWHCMNFRVQGGIRSYGAALVSGNRLALVKNNNGYVILDSVPFEWNCNNEYRLKVRVEGSQIEILHNGKVLIDYTDRNDPYLRGQIGVSLQNGSHCHFKDFRIK